MNTEDFYSIMSLGFTPSPSNPDMMNPAVLVSSNLFNVELTPMASAGLLASVMECIIDKIPENEQIDFEKNTIKLFKKVMKERHNFVDRYDLKQEEEK